MEVHSHEKQPNKTQIMRLKVPSYHHNNRLGLPGIFLHIPLIIFQMQCVLGAYIDRHRCILLLFDNFFFQVTDTPEAK